MPNISNMSGKNPTVKAITKAAMKAAMKAVNATAAVIAAKLRASSITFATHDEAVVKAAQKAVVSAKLKEAKYIKAAAAIKTANAAKAAKDADAEEEEACQPFDGVVNLAPTGSASLAAKAAGQSIHDHLKHLAKKSDKGSVRHSNKGVAHKGGKHNGSKHKGGKHKEDARPRVDDFVIEHVGTIINTNDSDDSDECGDVIRALFSPEPEHTPAPPSRFDTVAWPELWKGTVQERPQTYHPTVKDSITYAVVCRLVNPDTVCSA